MSWLYDRKLVAKGSPGRVHYEEIKSAPLYNRCPLCGQRDVWSLDHFLDKSRYPSLALTPTNLVPACYECNFAKRSHAPKAAGQFTLNPYFDNIEGGLWLHASIIEGLPIGVVFRIEAPEGSSRLLEERVHSHFSVFQLANLYASHAAEELSYIEDSMRLMIETSGTDSTRSFLIGEAASREIQRKNSWQTALYRALAASEWYITGSWIG